MAEDLSAYLTEVGLRSRYLHSELEAIERMELLRGLRLGEFDVLVGINLLREGLDLPEVSLVAILDADKVGFLRSARSIIQTAGRSARNAAGTVILYADEITPAMEQAIAETSRRRLIQLKYNEEHNITPKTIIKTREQVLATTQIASLESEFRTSEETIPDLSSLPIDEQIELLSQMMKEASDNLEFEFAIKIRDKIRELKKNFIPRAKPLKKKSRYGKFKRRGII
jgi:excinuclease ABC subunit B